MSAKIIDDWCLQFGLDLFLFENCWKLSLVPFLHETNDPYVAKSTPVYAGSFCDISTPKNAYRSQMDLNDLMSNIYGLQVHKVFNKYYILVLVAVA